MGFVKCGSGDIMAWKCFAASGLGNLVFIENNTDQCKSINILKKIWKYLPNNLEFKTQSKYIKITIPNIQF